MTAIPSIEKITEFHKANYEAILAANTKLLKGLEEISKELIALTQSHFESAATAGKAALAAKTVKDVVELQTAFTKSSLETLVANTTKISELSKKVGTEAIAPVSARVKSASELLKVAA